MKRTPDEYQQSAIVDIGNTLLIAAAGSGKTFTIINKIDYLINYKNYQPNEILVISFTNKSVDDLKNKINHDVLIYTFHKLAIDILKHNKINYQLCSDTTLEYITNEYFHSFISPQLKLKLLKLYDLYNYDTFLTSSYLKELQKIIITYIHLFKTNNANMTKFKEAFHLDELLTTIILEIYTIYEQELKSSNTYDFDDLITMATKYAHNYRDIKYIIIDEFQDTSAIRWQLINKIREVNNSYIFAVGDDYQSIFKFSGCDINIFLNFTTLVPNSKILKLKYTYRNSQELIDIASIFITKNPHQIKKELLSPHHLNNPIRFIKYFRYQKTFLKLLHKLTLKYNDILILGRNNFDILPLINNISSLEDNHFLFNNKKIKYLTVHSSKGLEAEVVILINLTNSLYGFPSQITNHQLINNLIPDNENILHAEERRLFYVALTRTQNEIYLLTPFFKKSPFLKELKNIITHQED